MNKFIVLISVLAHGTSALAASDYNTKVNDNKTTTQATSATREGTGTTTTATGTTSTPIQTSTINPGAQQAKKSQNSGAAANAATGAALMAVGASLLPPPTTPQGAMLMAMGLLALMQAKHDKGAAGESAATGVASNTNGTDTQSVDPEKVSDSSGTAGLVEAKIKEGTAKLAEAGYKVTEAGVTSPDGTFTPASSFNSSSGMAAAGMSPSSIAAAEKILGEADASAFKVSAVDVNSGGGGSGMSEVDGGGGGGEGGGSATNPWSLGDKEKAGLVAGKTVMFDGDPIGVRGQNIFDMVHNCYQKKRTGKHFIEGEGEVSVRAPASLQPASLKPAKK